MKFNERDLKAFICAVDVTRIELVQNTLFLGLHYTLFYTWNMHLNHIHQILHNPQAEMGLKPKHLFHLDELG